MKHSVSRLLDGEQHLKSRPSSEDEEVDEREKRLDQVEAELLFLIGADEGASVDDTAGRAGRGGASTLREVASSIILPIEKMT